MTSKHFTPFIMEPSTTTRIGIILVDHNLEALSDTFHVFTSTLEFISDLKKRIKEEAQDDLTRVDAKKLIVWRCTDSTTALDDDNLQMFQVRDLFSKQKVKSLGGGRTLAELNILKGETLLVQVPSVKPPAGKYQYC